MAVTGESPYARCRSLEPPAIDEQRFGALTFRIHQRTLEIVGLARPVTLAAFAGPGPGPAPSASNMAALAADKPGLVLVLGDIGDSEPVARATTKALANSGVPVLLVAGARDTPTRLSAAHDETGRVIEVSGFDALRIDNDTFVPLAGTYLGRNAIADDGCGYGADDLSALTKALGPRKSGRRWLLAWQAPTGGVAGSAIDAGSSEVERFAQAVGATGGLFAWPGTQAGRAFAAERRVALAPGAASASDLQLVVPRLTPPALERADGSRLMPGYALLRLDGAGIQLLAIRSAP